MSDILRKIADEIEHTEGGNIIAEIYCTTAAIGGIYINFINAQ